MILLFLSQIFAKRIYALSRKISNKKKLDNRRKIFYVALILVGKNIHFLLLKTKAISSGMAKSQQMAWKFGHGKDGESSLASNNKKYIEICF